MTPTTVITVLVCVVGFSAFGKDYQAGQTVPDEDTASWPPGTLDTRLQHGWVKYSSIPQAASEPEEDANNILPHPELLEGLSKAEIVAAVEAALGLEEGDSGLNADKLNKADLLTAAKTLLAEHQQGGD